MLSTLLMLDHSLTESINLQLYSATIKIEFKIGSNVLKV